MAEQDRETEAADRSAAAESLTRSTA